MVVCRGACLAILILYCCVVDKHCKCTTSAALYCWLRMDPVYRQWFYTKCIMYLCILVITTQLDSRSSNGLNVHRLTLQLAKMRKVCSSNVCEAD